MSKLINTTTAVRPMQWVVLRKEYMNYRTANEKGYGVKQPKEYRPTKKLKDQPHCFQKPKKAPDWDKVNWRTLEKGEKTHAGDWYFDDYERDSSKHQWLQVEKGFEREAPDPKFTAHYTYRRIIQ